MPVRNSSTPTRATTPTRRRKFSDLVAAYDVLSNHRTRREYDRTRRRGAPALVERNRPVATSAAAAQGAGAAGERGPRSSRGRWSRLLGVGAALLTWRLHQSDARRHARFHPVTAVRVGDGEITFTTPEGREVRTREPQQHGEGAGLGPTVRVRYDPADPAHVIVDADTVGRDITLADRGVEAPGRRGRVRRAGCAPPAPGRAAEPPATAAR